MARIQLDRALDALTALMAIPRKRRDQDAAIRQNPKYSSFSTAVHGHAVGTRAIRNSKSLRRACNGWTFHPATGASIIADAHPASTGRRTGTRTAVPVQRIGLLIACAKRITNVNTCLSGIRVGRRLIAHGGTRPRTEAPRTSAAIGVLVGAAGSISMISKAERPNEHAGTRKK